MRGRAAGVLAALLVAGALPAAAAPTGVRVSQEGLASRVSWTPDPAETEYVVEVSGSPDVPSTVGAGCAAAVDAAFTLDARVGGLLSDRRALLREATAVATAAGGRLALGAARE